MVPRFDATLMTSSLQNARSTHQQLDQGSPRCAAQIGIPCHLEADKHVALVNNLPINCSISNNSNLIGDGLFCY